MSIFSLIVLVPLLAAVASPALIAANMAPTVALTAANVLRHSGLAVTVRD